MWDVGLVKFGKWRVFGVEHGACQSVCSGECCACDVRRMECVRCGVLLGECGVWGVVLV